MKGLITEPHGLMLSWTAPNLENLRPHDDHSQRQRRRVEGLVDLVDCRALTPAEYAAPSKARDYPMTCPKDRQNPQRSVPDTLPGEDALTPEDATRIHEAAQRIAPRFFRERYPALVTHDEEVLSKQTPDEK